MGFISPVQPPLGPVRWQREETAVFVEKQDLSKGTLYIAESHVAWINPNGQGFQIPYRAITVHAISKDLAAFPHECLYLMIDSDVMGELRDMPGHSASGDVPRDSENSDDDGFEEEEGTEVREIRFIPQDKSSLQSMFDAMSQCQTLHPDPDDPGDSDASDTSDTYDQGDEGGAEPEMGGTEDGAGDAMDTGQFDDADMDPEH